MKKMTIKNQKGVAAIEFAIVLPLFVIIVFGIIEFSLVFYAKAVITNASREGARLGISALDAAALDEDEAKIIEAIKDRIVNECLYNSEEPRFINLGAPPLTKAELRELIEVPPIVDDVITVTIKDFPYNFLVFSYLLPGFADDNKLNISATTKMKDEPS